MNFIAKLKIYKELKCRYAEIIFITDKKTDLKKFNCCF